MLGMDFFLNTGNDRKWDDFLMGEDNAPLLTMPLSFS